MRLRFRLSLLKKRHQIRLFFGDKWMRIVNRSHHRKEECLHCILRPLPAKLFVDGCQVGPQGATVWKRETRDAVTGDARRSPILKTGSSNEQCLAARG